MPSPSKSAEYPAGLRQTLLALLGRERHPLAVHVTASFKVKAAYGDPSEYGLTIVEEADIREALPALYGCSTAEAIDLPLVELSSGNVVDLHLTPDDSGDGAYVILLDSTAMAQQSQSPQQRANEVALMNYRQEQLMAALSEARREAEAASKLKSEFIANFSHEFRTPLTSILGYCGLKQGDVDGEHAGAIRRAANHLLSLVENLLDHGRTEHDRIELLDEVVDIAALFADVESLLAPLAKQRGLTWTVTGNSDCPALLGDPIRLRQIVVNLANNALKYTNEGGARVDWRYRRGKLRVNVSDSGPGIPEGDREKIFRAFAQGRNGDGRGGLGLGLALARRLADAMGGSLELVKTNEPGATFQFRARLRPALAAAEDQQATVQHRERSVIIIEDDPDVSTLLELMLTEFGYTCRVVPGLSELEQTLSDVEFSAALVDMHLPDGSGTAAIRALTGGPDAIPVLAMSASTAETTRRDALSAGAAGLITKPFDFNQLARRLEEL